MEENDVKSVVMVERIIGCPHEEGVDYPEGEYCPKCVYWKGRDRFTHEFGELAEMSRLKETTSRVLVIVESLSLLIIVLATVIAIGFAVVVMVMVEAGRVVESRSAPL